MEGDRFKRVFDVLTMLATYGPCTVTEVSTALSLPISSTHDLLKGLAKTGIVDASKGGYVIGPATLKLSFEVQKQFDIVKLASPELERLVERVGFDVYLAIRTGSQVLYAARFPGRKGLNIDIPLGLPLYRHATSVGKLYAAFDREIHQALIADARPQLTHRTRTDLQEIERDLASIRSRGISISREEAVTGIVGIATPIRNADGQIAGAAHISALKSTLAGARLQEVCTELQAATAAIEQHLGYGSALRRTPSIPTKTTTEGPPIAANAPIQLVH